MDRLETRTSSEHGGGLKTKMRCLISGTSKHVLLRTCLFFLGISACASVVASTSSWINRSNQQLRVYSGNEPNELESNIDLYSTPPFKFLVIASLQRSASTSLLYSYFAKKYEAGNEFPGKKTIRVVPVNELFNNFKKVQSGDHWSVDAWDMPGLSKPRDATPWQLKMFLQRVHKRRCNGTDTRDMCVIAFKLFSTHLTPEQHYTILSLQSVRIIVLERDFASRLTSQMYAIESGDWNTAGDAAHKEALLHSQVTIPNTTDCQIGANKTRADVCKFYDSHVQWYKFLRKTFDVYAELTYDDVLELVSRFS